MRILTETKPLPVNKQNDMSKWWNGLNMNITKDIR